MFRARLQGLNFLQVSLALTLVWTTAAYQVVALSSNLGYQTYYVKPTAEGGSHGMQCPGVCHNLSYYLKNVSHYFTHNTKFYFMSGVHEVNSTGLVCIRDISNLVLEGSNKSDVRVVDVHLKTINVTQPTSILHCSLPSGFVFLNVTNLTLRSIMISNCGAQIEQWHWSVALSTYTKLDHLYTHADHQGMQAALFLVDITNLTIHSSSVQESTGYGLLGINILGMSLLSNSVLLNNNYNRHKECRQKTDISCQGGNTLLVYTERVQCSMQLEEHSLLTQNSFFMYGYDVRNFSTIESGYYISGGSGIGIQIAPVSYRIEIVLDHVLTAENKGMWIDGINVCIRVFDSSRDFSVIVQHSDISSSGASLSSELHPYERSKSFGYRYGIRLPTHFTRNCPVVQNAWPSCNLHISHTVFTHNSVTAVFIQFESSSHKCTHFTEIQNCKLAYNIGAIASTLFVRQSKANADPTLFAIIAQNCSIFGNSNYYGLGYMYAYYPIPPGTSTITLESVQNITFNNCTFNRNEGTAIHAFDSNMHFGGTVMFSNNKGDYGGSLSLHGATFMYLKTHTQMKFYNNHANKRGGAIYVSKRGIQTLPLRYLCFFQLEHVTHKTLHNESFAVFENNTAEIAGSALYGGSIDTCLLEIYGQKQLSPSADLFSLGLLRITRNISDPSPVSSDPEHLCLCEEGTQLQCTDKTSEYNELTLYPGQDFQIEVAAAGQMFGLVPAVFYSTLSDPEHSYFGTFQEAQEVAARCKNLTYTIYSLLDSESMRMIVSSDEKSVSLSAESLELEVTFLNCPPGFWLSPDNWGCDCAPILQKYNITCNINDQTIERTESLWIQALPEGLIIIHDHCPEDYCNSAVTKLNLSNPDEQCTSGRFGILCGGCRKKLSLVLGTSQCLECSNLYLFLIVPFAVAGLILVCLLILLNLTVSVGTVNGLIFYANIVRVNHAVFFQHWNRLHVPNRILDIFIAFLNLDLGVQTCFYNGMDNYTRTWLQFVFPVYIWVIVGAIIFLSRHSTIIVKLVGRNALSILATLFLLSYAKLLRTIITVFSFTHWKYEDGTLSHSIWLYDGNVEFLKGKHIILFVSALLFWILFLLPFTLLLLFIPCLQAHSGHRALQCWMKYLMPLLDAYQAPYKDKFRYWTGLMLVLRNILFIAFAANTLGDPQINLAVIATVVVCLLTVTWQIGSVYKRWTINVLESSLILNLGILSIWSLLQREDTIAPNRNQAIITFIMVSIAFITFILIVVYHLFVKLKQSRILEYISQHCKKNQHAVPDIQLEELDNASTESLPDPPPCQPPTVTFIDLREPLLTDS